MSTEEEQAENLRTARENSPSQTMHPAKKVRELAKMATPMGAISLAAQINPFLDLPFFGIALSLAILKDIFDLLANASVVFLALVFVLTPVVSFTIALCLYIMGAGSRTQKNARKTGNVLKRFLRGGPATRYGLIFAGTIFELIPVLDSLPLETTIVVITFGMLLNERRENSRAARTETV